jgi:putative sterol carrier protein
MSDSEAAVKAIFEAMPGRLNASAAAGLDCVIQYDLSGDGAAQYFNTIKEGACSVSEGTHESPTMTVSMTAGDFVDLTEGKLDGMAAFMGGKLKIAGDMGLAMKLQSLFS